MSAIGKVLVVVAFAFAVPVWADDDAPAIHQAKPNFYNAMTTGNLVVSWSATPTEFAIDSETVLTLTIAGATNPHRIRRPDLANVPAFKREFREIANSNDPPASREAKSVTFTYRLRPRTAGKLVIPELPFLFYHSPSDSIREKFLDKIELTIRPNIAEPPARPLDAPERFFELPDSAKLGLRISSPSVFHWLSLVVGLSVVGTVWVFAWRHFNPDGLRLARLRQNLAIREALDGLESAKRSSEPVERTQRILETYLLERHGRRTIAAVPSELEEILRETNVPSERIETVMRLLRECEAARFSTSVHDANKLLSSTREFILSEEVAA